MIPIDTIRKLAKAADMQGLSTEFYALLADRAAFREDANRLTAERAVLLDLLTDCAAVLRTIDPDDSDEAETLADLLGAIDRAIEPSRHKGALL